MRIPTAAAPEQVSVSYDLRDAAGRSLAAESPGRPFYAASTIKLHVLLAALQDVDRGALDLERKVPVTRTFTGSDGAPFTLGGDHLDPTHPAEGEAITVRELLVRMIDRSSNEATNHIVEIIGLAAVARAIAALGLSGTRIERLIGDASALATGATNETTAGDLAMTMRAAISPVAAAPLSASCSELAREALRAQQIPVIGAVLRAGVDWGSKSGWIDGYRHDVAFVGDPESPDLRVLAVMTAGLAPGAADEKIADLTRELLPDAVG